MWRIDAASDNLYISAAVYVNSIPIGINCDSGNIYPVGAREKNRKMAALENRYVLYCNVPAVFKSYGLVRKPVKQSFCGISIP